MTTRKLLFFLIFLIFALQVGGNAEPVWDIVDSKILPEGYNAYNIYRDNYYFYVLSSNQLSGGKNALFRFSLTGELTLLAEMPERVDQSRLLSVFDLFVADDDVYIAARMMGANRMPESQILVYNLESREFRTLLTDYLGKSDLIVSITRCQETILALTEGNFYFKIIDMANGICLGANKVPSRNAMLALRNALVLPGRDYQQNTPFFATIRMNDVYLFSKWEYGSFASNDMIGKYRIDRRRTPPLIISGNSWPVTPDFDIEVDDITGDTSILLYDNRNNRIMSYGTDLHPRELILDLTVVPSLSGPEYTSIKKQGDFFILADKGKNTIFVVGDISKNLQMNWQYSLALEDFPGISGFFVNPENGRFYIDDSSADRINGYYFTSINLRKSEPDFTWQSDFWEEHEERQLAFVNDRQIFISGEELTFRAKRRSEIVSTGETYCRSPLAVDRFDNQDYLWYIQNQILKRAQISEEGSLSDIRGMAYISVQDVRAMSVIADSTLMFLGHSGLQRHTRHVNHYYYADEIFEQRLNSFNLGDILHFVVPEQNQSVFFVLHRRSNNLYISKFNKDATGRIGEQLIATNVGSVSGYLAAFNNKEIYYLLDDGRLGLVLDLLETRPIYLAPYADAGLERVMMTGDTAWLSATGSIDLNGSPLSYTWQALDYSPTTIFSGSPAIFVPEQKETYFNPLLGEIKDTIDFELEVSNNNNESKFDTVRIWVRDFDQRVSFINALDTLNWGNPDCEESWLESVDSSWAIVPRQNAITWSRSVKAVPGTFFRLCVEMKAAQQGNLLTLSVDGLQTNPLTINYTLDTLRVIYQLDGYSVDSIGTIRVTCEGIPVDTLAIYSIVWDDRAMNVPQFSVLGTVTQAEDGSPFGGVRVEVSNLDENYQTLSDEQGEWSIDNLVKGQSYTLHFSSAGYLPADTILYFSTANPTSDTVINMSLTANSRPVAQAVTSVDSVAAGEYVTLRGDMSYDPEGESLTFRWDEWDGQSIREISDQAVFSLRIPECNDDTYRIILSVSDGEFNAYDTVALKVIRGPAAEYGYLESLPLTVNQYKQNQKCAIDAVGRLWVAGQTSTTGITIWNPGTGQIAIELSEFVQDSRVYDCRSNCYGLENGADGYIYYSGWDNDNGYYLLKIEPASLTCTGSWTALRPFAKPAVSNCGDLYFVLAAQLNETNPIVHCDASGNVSGSFTCDIEGRVGMLELSADGSQLFVAISEPQGEIHVIDLAGPTYAFSLPGPFDGGITALEIDSRGRLWTADRLTNQVYFYLNPSDTLSLRPALEFDPALTTITGIAFSDGDSTLYFVGEQENLAIQKWLESASDFLVKNAAGLPEQTRDLRNYPNPFNYSTRIRYTVTECGPVELCVYNLVGEKVRTLVNDVDHSSGSFDIVWNGQNDAGQEIAAGIYFYRLRFSADKQFTRRMLFLK